MNRRTLGAVVILALALRLIVIAWVDVRPANVGEHQQIAAHLTRGEGFSYFDFGALGPTSIRAPIYPVVLCSIYQAFGIATPSANAIALLLNALLGATSAGLIYALTRRAWAGVLWAIWPTQLLAVSLVQPLALGVTLLLILLLTLRAGRPIASGFIAGAAVLSESVLLFPTLLLIFATGSLRPRQSLLALLALTTVTLPWAYRNTLVHAQLTGVTTNLGADLFRGNGPGATGSQHTGAFRGHESLSRIDQLPPPQFDSLKNQPEAARANVLGRWALDWITTHPVSYLTLCARRAAHTLWLDWNHPIASSVFNVLTRTAGAAILTCVIFFPRRDPRWLGPIMLTLGLLLATIFTMSEARNAIFLDAAVLLSLVWIVDQWRTAKTSGKHFLTTSGTTSVHSSVGLD